MTVQTRAPRRLNITVSCGDDFAVVVTYTDDLTGLPVFVTAPRAQVREGAYVDAPLIATFDCSVLANVITAVLHGTDTTDPRMLTAYYDLFATRLDTQAPVKLLKGHVTFVPSVTDLT